VAAGNREEVIMVPVSAVRLLLSGYNIKELSSRAITSLSGHLRARPDPWLECALRDAFSEFDRELTVILRDRNLTRSQEDLPSPNSQ
jgi:hypothetical protein